MEKDIEAIAEAVANKLKKAEQAICCGGLKKEQIEKLAGWTQDGGFTEDQMDALRNFINMLMKGKRYFFIGFGLVCVYALKDIWGAIWYWFQHLFHKGGTWT